jgi:hypothetical protein
VCAASCSALLLALLLRNTDVHTLLTSKTDERDVREVTINNANVSGKRLRDVHLPRDVLVLSIRRGEDFIILMAKWKSSFSTASPCWAAFPTWKKLKICSHERKRKKSLSRNNRQ